MMMFVCFLQEDILSLNSMTRLLFQDLLKVNISELNRCFPVIMKQRFQSIRKNFKAVLNVPLFL